jgi:L-arabinose isomerase
MQRKVNNLYLKEYIMVKILTLAILLTANCALFSAAAKQPSASPEEIEATFEAYKQCMKQETKSDKKKITKANYKNVCKKELAQLKESAKNNYAAIETIIEQWLENMALEKV